MDNPAPAAPAAPAQGAFDNPNPQPSQDLNFDDDFGSLRNAIRATPDAPNQEGEKSAKQEKKAAEKPAEDKPKSFKDKLKVEEEPVEEETTLEEVDDDDLPTYKDRKPTDKEKATWKGLKQAKAEYDKLKPEFEKLKSEYEEFKKKPVFDDEVTKELDELRRFRDMTDFKLSDTYQKEIAQPIGSIDNDITEMVAEFKIDKDGLAKAFTEISEWKRNLAIEKVLKEADEEVPNGIIKTILDNAGELHKLWKMEAEMEQDSAKKLAAYEYEKKQAVTKQTLEEQKAWQAALDNSTQMIESQMAPLLKGLPQAQKDELMTALKEASIAETPEDRALQAQAPHIAAVLIEHLNSLKKEMAELKKTNKALSAASPASNGRQPEARKADDDDDEGLFRAIRQSSGR